MLCLSSYLSEYLSVYMFDYQYVCLTVWLSDCQSNCLTVWLSDCLSDCNSIFLSVARWVMNSCISENAEPIFQKLNIIFMYENKMYMNVQNTELKLYTFSFPFLLKLDFQFKHFSKPGTWLLTQGSEMNFHTERPVKKIKFSVYYRIWPLSTYYNHNFYIIIVHNLTRLK